MTTQFGADYLHRLADAVDAFAVAFESWMETQVESDHMTARGLWPTVWTRDDADERIVKSRSLAVAEAAGLAAKAVPVTGAYIVVQGVGRIDPIANWHNMGNPRAMLAPSDIRTMTATMKGRLHGLALEAETGARDGLPTFGPFALHEVIWCAAAPLWTTHKYRVAVREAAEALSIHWKTRLNRLDVDDTVFWQQTLSANDPDPGRPRLCWPGELSDKTVKSMRGGLVQLATGLNLTIRNVATHTNEELTEQEALERLGAYSYLARQLDRCDVRLAAGDDLPSSS